MNTMKKVAATLLLALSMAGCGGGGAGTPGGTGNPTVISGMASKGPITGSVKIYALNANGSRGTLLASAPVTNGSYSTGIGTYVGPVLLEASGSYTDEATGTTVTVDTDHPLRAAVAHATGSVAVAVTPLTELAVQKATTLTESGIADANTLVSGIFNFDVTATVPVAPTAAALAGATTSQKDYTLALAAISQLSRTRGATIATTLADLAASITTTGMESQAMTSFQSAAASFIANPNNATGVTDLSQTSLGSITGTIATTVSYTLSLQGVAAATAVKGLELEVVVPDGLSVRHNATTGETLPGIVTASAAVAAATPYLLATYSTSSGAGVLGLAVMSESGFGPGAIATITCDVLPGYAVPAASAFGIRNQKASDGNGATIEGLTAVIN